MTTVCRAQRTSAVFFFALFSLSLALAALAAAAGARAAPGDVLWVRAQGGSTLAEEYRDLASGPKGSVYAVGLAGGTEESGRLLVARWDRDGDRLWARTYAAGGAGASGLRAVAVPGGVAVVGTAGNPSSPRGRDIVVVKYSHAGKRLWVTRYDGRSHRDDTPAGIDFGGEGVGGNAGVIYVGGTSVGKDTGRDYVTLQINQFKGWIVWARRYDGPASRDELTALDADAEGNVYVTGESVDAGGGSTAAATIAYDIVGHRLWARRLHAGVGPASGAGVAVDVGRRGVYVAGGTVGGMSTGRELMLVRLAPSTGATRWVRTAGITDGHEDALALAGGGVHGWALAGMTADRTTGATKGVVAVWSADGTALWQRTYDGGFPGDAAFATVTRDAAGHVYCGGFASGPGGGRDFAVVSYLPNGDLDWDDAYDGAAHGTDLARDVLARSGALYAAGLRSEAAALDTSALLVKYAK